MPEADPLLLRVLDELYLQYPFYGRRRRVDALADRGQPVHRKRVQRWMRILGIEAWYRKPHTSRAHPEHAAYPYRLRGLTINRPNQVGCTEVTYVPRAHGFACLCVARRQAYRVAVMDWYSRKVLSWRVSNTLATDFCVAALAEALARNLPLATTTWARRLRSGVRRSWAGMGGCQGGKPTGSWAK